MTSSPCEAGRTELRCGNPVTLQLLKRGDGAVDFILCVVEMSRYPDGIVAVPLVLIDVNSFSVCQRLHCGNGVDAMHLKDRGTRCGGLVRRPAKHFHGRY